MLTVSRRRPSWSLAWATWTSPWVSTPTVTRVGWACAMVVMAISLRLRAWGGWHAPAGWADSTAMGLWAQASIRSRLLGWRCEAVAAASSRQIRSRARSRWTAGVRPLPRPPETSSQWTLPRIAEVIWRLTGVSYHPGACVVAAAPPPLEPAAARPPRQRTRRAGDRSLAGRGVAEDQRGAAKQGAWICFVDESGAALTPPVRRTWAPRGHTPIFRHRMRGRKRISLAGVCCYRPDASDARLAFHLREGAYDTDQLIPIVAALGRLLGGDAPVILVWDNLPAHHSLAMHAWLASQHAWLQVEYLPAYAPDLNPVEGLWANLKGVELANRACQSLEELAAAAEQGIGRVRGEPELLFGFLHRAGLSL